MNKYTLTPLQESIMNSSGKVVLKACPGSGKTFVVANKILKEIRKWNKKNSGIAALSFSNAASIELASQIIKISKDYVIEYPHYLGTLDSFVSQNLFMPFGYLIMKCEDRPSIIQDYSIAVHEYANRIWRRECYDNNCKYLEFYFDAKGEIRNLNKDISNCPCGDRRPCIQFKNYCYKNGYATYSDLNSIAIRILSEYPQIGEILSTRYSYIIIDEGQDTSADQMKIIELLVAKGTRNVMIIGDPDQAIYEWRDADPSIFINKYNDLEWQPQLLNENFRCSQKICNATRVFSSLPEKSLAVGETADYEFKPRIIKYDVMNREKVIEGFLATCENKGIEINEENVTVLVRGKTGLLGKDYSQLKELWQSPLAKILSKASFDKSNKFIMKATESVKHALYYLYIDPLSGNKIDELRIKEYFLDGVWEKMIFDFSVALPSGRYTLKEWKTEITDLIRKFTITFNLRIIGNPEIKIKTRTNDKNLKDFMQQPINDFYAKSYNSGYLNTTIHSVKGRTFDAVLLLIAQKSKLTSNMMNNNPIDSEPIRTAYVAMTRARKILVVAIPNTVKNKTMTRFPSKDWDYFET